mmetsp:Transcript_24113/g.33184  ORF Transcript_24113/g.33184 Transcript_24113/m.33184 type:complete len:141 (-) Transcript_24113:131-553(-)|eukprot:CAMPEP_0196594720 /NCGR_PEP_ID=MMETSP1081-20130531/79093_1 /TAXON_ID=36882 /ORGANISM="Pyramimonas amylifera, Strain CCMP720" /LENGTH=140 /DNA_ID=CAMNT_0041919057 /DNA_START=248 /DNA_END=670 /DNA_ORIENTATION=+
MSRRSKAGSSGAKSGAAVGVDEAKDAPAAVVGGVIKRKRGTFTRDLKSMMYGFGDVAHPLQETVDVVEELVVDYMSDMIHKAMEGGPCRGKITHQDFVFLVRKDRRKYERCQEILQMQQDIDLAKKNFEYDENSHKDEAK